MHVHPQVGVLAQQVSAQFAAQLRAFHRERFIRALGFHLKGADAAQRFAKISFRRGADLVKILAAAGSAAHFDNAKNFGNTAERFVHVQVIFQWLNEHGGLRLGHLEFAQVFQPVADAFGQAGFKFAAVQAFQGHFA